MNYFISLLNLFYCEVWGFGSIEVIERVQLKFMKYILKLKNSTPNYIVYSKLGMMPLKIDFYVRMVSYWGKINDYELNTMN